MSKRRGETLVEVVVSFAIISLVLMGITGLISSLVGMVTEARTVTEATALAQQGLVDGVAMVNTSCDIREETPGFVENELILELISPHDAGRGLNQVVELRQLYDTEQDSIASLPEDTDRPSYGNRFRKVVSTVTWNDKLGSPQSYTLVQVVKR